MKAPQAKDVGFLKLHQKFDNADGNAINEETANSSS